MFHKIDFGNSSVEYIDWIKPRKHESLANYAKRISKNISSPKPIIIGLSFGGILAVEISKLIEVEKLILIASVKTKLEIPKAYRIFGKLKLNTLIPNKLLKKSNIISNWLFGLQNKEDKRLLEQILKDTDSKFLGWAINEILNWENTEEPKNCTHIHGTSDRILPIKNIKTIFIIKRGGHFMTVNKPQEISEIIKNTTSDLAEITNKS